MTLFELARELFTYLVRFREKASTTAAPPLAEVRGDLLGIFSRMDNHAKREPVLQEPYRQVHYALVALADEVILTSGWEHATAWRQALLEERFYHTKEAGRRFFELAKGLDDAPQDVRAIFYLCLALGFSGHYAPADPELAEIKEELLARLPSKPRIMDEARQARAQTERRQRGWLWSLAALAVIVGAAAIAWNQWPSSQPPQPAPPPRPVEKPAAPPAAASEKPGPSRAVAPAPAAEKPAPKPEAAPAPPAPPPPPPPPSPAKPATPPPPPPPAPAARPATVPPQPSPTPEARPVEKPAAPAPTKAASPAKGKGYRVRVGVYVGPIQSGRLADKLKQAGYPVRVEKLERPGGRTLFVVSITPLSSRAEAERVRAEIKDRFQIEAVIKKN